MTNIESYIENLQKKPEYISSIFKICNRTALKYHERYLLLTHRNIRNKQGKNLLYKYLEQKGHEMEFADLMLEAGYVLSAEDYYTILRKNVSRNVEHYGGGAWSGNQNCAKIMWLIDKIDDLGFADSRKLTEILILDYFKENNLNMHTYFNKVLKVTLKKDLLETDLTVGKFKQFNPEFDCNNIEMIHWFNKNFIIYSGYNIDTLPKLFENCDDNRLQFVPLLILKNENYLGGNVREVIFNNLLYKACRLNVFGNSSPWVAGLKCYEEHISDGIKTDSMTEAVDKFVDDISRNGTRNYNFQAKKFFVWLVIYGYIEEIPLGIIRCFRLTVNSFKTINNISMHWDDTESILLEKPEYGQYDYNYISDDNGVNATASFDVDELDVKYNKTPFNKEYCEEQRELIMNWLDEYDQNGDSNSTNTSTGS